jgi:ribosomal protein L31
VDAPPIQIDVLSENEDNIPNNREGLRVLEKPVARSNNLSVQERQVADVAQKLARNVAANEAFIQQHYPNEKFLSDTAQLQAANRYTKKIVLPENVRVAVSRVNIKSNEEQRTLRKELRQAGILSRRGNSVFLTPEKPEFGVRVTDGVVNGLPYEFRNVTGTVKKIEKRFGNAKEKGNAVNVFLNLENNASINEARRRIGLVLGRHPEYTGKIIVSTREGKVYFWESGSFRK